MAKVNKLLIFIILTLLIGGLFFLNKKTSKTFSEICTDAGWKSVPQINAETGLEEILCWKAENPLIVSESYTYDCTDGEVVYYFVDRNPALVKTAMGNDLFNYIAKQCTLTGY